MRSLLVQKFLVARECALDLALALSLWRRICNESHCESLCVRVSCQSQRQWRAFPTPEEQPAPGHSNPRSLQIGFVMMMALGTGGLNPWFHLQRNSFAFPERIAPSLSGALRFPCQFKQTLFLFRGSVLTVAVAAVHACALLHLRGALRKSSTVPIPDDLIANVSEKSNLSLHQVMEYVACQPGFLDSCIFSAALSSYP